MISLPVYTCVFPLLTYTHLHEAVCTSIYTRYTYVYQLVYTIHPLYTSKHPYIHPTCIPSSYTNSYTRQVKIVVATNAAESSITLPDCDHVICLGTAKRMEYDMKIHYIFSVCGATHMCAH